MRIASCAATSQGRPAARISSATSPPADSAAHRSVSRPSVASSRTRRCARYWSRNSPTGSAAARSTTSNRAGASTTSSRGTHSADGGSGCSAEAVSRRIAWHSIRSWVRARRTPACEESRVDLPRAAQDPAWRMGRLLIANPVDEFLRVQRRAAQFAAGVVELDRQERIRSRLDKSDPSFGSRSRRGGHRRRATKRQLTGRTPRCAPGCSRTPGRRSQRRVPRGGCRSGRCWRAPCGTLRRCLS